MSVIWVNRFGTAFLRLGSIEVARGAEAVASILEAAAPPERCGPEMPIAPARGPMEAFQPREMVITDAGNPVSRRAGYLGRDAARVADAFDRMTLAAQKAHAGAVRRAEARGDPIPSFDAPFTHGQVSAARDYAALSERCQSHGLATASVETRGGGSGGNGGREEAIFADFQRLRALHRRIGEGLAKEVRRLRPSATGGKRRAIRARRLVDMVCLGDAVISDVLAAHGWAENARERSALRLSLCAALDRMQGYDLTKPQNMGLTSKSAGA